MGQVINSVLFIFSYKNNENKSFNHVISISRSWQRRSYVQSVELVIIDEIHLLGVDRGPVLVSE
jgi:hypothetical protein